MMKIVGDAPLPATHSLISMRHLFPLLPRAGPRGHLGIGGPTLFREKEPLSLM